MEGLIHFFYVRKAPVDRMGSSQPPALKSQSAQEDICLYNLLNSGRYLLLLNGCFGLFPELPDNLIDQVGKLQRPPGLAFL